MSGAIWTRVSMRTPQILMIAMFFSSSTHVWINAFGISMIVTFLSSSASMMHDKSMASVVTVGELASIFLGHVVLHCCLFLPASHSPFLEGSALFLLEKHEIPTPSGTGSSIVCSNALAWTCSRNVVAPSPMLPLHMLCHPITSNHSWVRAVSWCVPRRWGQIGRNLLGQTCGSPGVELPVSPAALWHRSTLNLSLGPINTHRV